MEEQTSRDPAGTDRLHQEMESLRLRMAFLEEENRYLRHLLFGRSSEKTPPPPASSLQPHLPLAGINAPPPLPVPAEPKIPVAAHTRKKAGRGPLPSALDRVEEVVDLPEEEKTCGFPCRCPLQRIGEEVSERLDYEPAKIRVIRTIRPKYAPPATCQGTTGSGEEGPVKVAPTPAQIIPYGNATAGLVAHVAVAKIADGIPLYRQEQQFRRLGLQVTRATLCNWLIIAATACSHLIELLWEELLKGLLINMDETRIQVLGEPGRANTSKSTMWVCRGGPPERPALIFHYDPSRSGDVVQKLLTGFRGYLQTDGYAGYNAIGERDGIRHLGCLAHVRRKFKDVERAASGPVTGGVANRALEIIGGIYGVEKKAREAHLKADEIKALREREAKPLLDALKAHLDLYAPTTPPKSLLGKAIGYALGQWPRLTVYLEDGNLRPDNNLAENAIRPFVVGRKAWLFNGSPAGAKAGAILFSLMETAKANGLEPFAYFRFLFTVLPRCTTREDLRGLLPQNLDRSRLQTRK